MLTWCTHTCISNTILHFHASFKRNDCKCINKRDCSLTLTVPGEKVTGTKGGYCTTDVDIRDDAAAPVVAVVTGTYFGLSPTALYNVDMINRKRVLASQLSFSMHAAMG